MLVKRVTTVFLNYFGYELISSETHFIGIQNMSIFYLTPAFVNFGIYNFSSHLAEEVMHKRLRWWIISHKRLQLPF